MAGFLLRPQLIGVQTSSGNRVGEITFTGTVALALYVGLFAGMAGGVFYAVAEPWLRSGRGKGLIFGGWLLLRSVSRLSMPTTSTSLASVSRR